MEIFEYLQSTLRKYRSSAPLDANVLNCDAMMLGSLTIGLNSIDIIQSPLPPYNGFSIHGLFQKLREMPLPQLCKEHSSYSYIINHGLNHGVNNRGDKYCEGVHKPLLAKISELESMLKGLELVDKI